MKFAKVLAIICVTGRYSDGSTMMAAARKKNILIMMGGCRARGAEESYECCVGDKRCRNLGLRSPPILSSNLHHPLFLLRGGGGKSNHQNDDSLDAQRRRRRTINALHQTSFLIVASTSMVVFSPLPSITRHLDELSPPSSSSLSPQARAVKILSILSAVCASIELFLSPLIGTLIDTFGRKRPAIILNALISVGNLGVVLHPGVTSVCISRMVNVIASGFILIVANSVIADVFSTPSSPHDSNDSGQMGSVLGRQAASVALGFLIGSITGGRLMEYGERAAYGAALVFSILAAIHW